MPHRVEQSWWRILPKWLIRFLLFSVKCKYISDSESLAATSFHEGRSKRVILHDPCNTYVGSNVDVGRVKMRYVCMRKILHHEGSEEGMRNEMIWSELACIMRWCQWLATTLGHTILVTLASDPLACMLCLGGVEDAMVRCLVLLFVGNPMARVRAAAWGAGVADALWAEGIGSYAEGMKRAQKGVSVERRESIAVVNWV